MIIAIKLTVVEFCLKITEDFMLVKLTDLEIVGGLRPRQ